jgi:NAD(P)H-dependent flavin oxidoreductase YrpB (nitropropane dioxygenase family)
MSEPKRVSRRDFLAESVAAAGAMGLVAGAGVGGLAQAAPAEPAAAAKPPAADAKAVPSGTLGKAKIGRMLLGGNLITGCTHSRDLQYVPQLFRAYMTPEKILQTMKLAEERGVNTVFESGGNFVDRYNRECGGHMQFIPHIEVGRDAKESDLRQHIDRVVDSGAVAVYVWGVSADGLVKAGAVDQLAKGVELAKAHDLPVGVGGHSLQVAIACEKAKVPCDFYVKTLHADNYPSATPKALRKDWMWMDGSPGYYDNMWCVDAAETIEFMKALAKPWIAYKVLAAGAIHPRQGFAYAFDNGADFIAVGMFDFHVQENCDLARAAIDRAQKRPRPWRA